MPGSDVGLVGCGGGERAMGERGRGHSDSFSAARANHGRAGAVILGPNNIKWVIIGWPSSARISAKLTMHISSCTNDVLMRT